MPEPKRKALLRALCLAAAGSALFASLYVGSTSAYFTDTATVQVETIRIQKPKYFRSIRPGGGHPRRCR